ncbi:SRPBCC family protein [Paraburkholderia jirisanensis]
MAGSTFIYVTYIRTSPDKLWKALTSPEFIRQYWFGMHCESDWQTGSSWRLMFEDGRVADTGEIVESTLGKRLAIRWRNEFKPELKAEGDSLCVMEIEATGDASKLTVTHSIDKDGSEFIRAVSGGWPRILSNLKSLLETGDVALASKPN